MVVEVARAAKTDDRLKKAMSHVALSYGANQLAHEHLSNNLACVGCKPGAYTVFKKM